eukprot:TRINITY_DN5312_c0_g1_i1.p4 TRINITY_DN5312_c0_g1~~TRINITY_DN5312_c0_g1_i1.p4  ORF type:complete len:110 (+),score=27.52 TRINITY_DN5312_c0_g1_i1:261-590(+)
MGPTHQMVFTAALLAAGADNSTTDVLLLNAEHRTLRQYADAFLPSHALHNTHGCHQSPDADCLGGLLMHWRLSPPARPVDLPAAFGAVAAAWADRRPLLDRLLVQLRRS